MNAGVLEEGRRQKAECRRRSRRRREAWRKARLDAIGARLSARGVAGAYAKSGRRQHSRAEDFVFAERLKRGIGNSDDGQRLTQRVEHLSTVAFGAIECGVVFHRLHDIAAFQAVFRQVPGQPGKKWGALSLRA